MYRLHFIDNNNLDLTVIKNYQYPAGTLNHFAIEMTEIRQNVFMITWIEEDTKNTVTHVDDFENKIAYTNITDVTSKTFYNLKGAIEPLD